MSAQIFLHPRSVEAYGIYGMASNLKTRGYDIPAQPGARFIRAEPEKYEPRVALNMKRPPFHWFRR